MSGIDASRVGLEDVRQAMREADGTGREIAKGFRGHRFMILWGVLWVLMPLSFEFLPQRQWWVCPALAMFGGVASMAIGIWQSRFVRSRPDRHFQAAMIGILAYAALGFIVLLQTAPGGRLDAKIAYAYGCLSAMAIYVLAGAWFRYFLYWFGLVTMAVTAVGLFAFRDIFWYWMALGTGIPLILAGVYERYRTT